MLAKLKGYRTYISAAAVGLAAFATASGLLTQQQVNTVALAGTALMGAFLRASQPDKAASPAETPAA